jgi:hypothetical protein
MSFRAISTGLKMTKDNSLVFYTEKEPLIPLDAGKSIVEVLIFLVKIKVPITSLLLEYQSCNLPPSYSRIEHYLL